MARRIHEFEHDFLTWERHVVMETVAADDSLIDHVDWRKITPGHSIEAVWFIVREAAYRNNDCHLMVGWLDRIGTPVR